MSQQPLIKPANLDALPYLPEAKKEYYKNGLAQLWQTYENNPQGSPQRTSAEAKIRQASHKIMSELAQYQRGGNGQQRPQSGGGPQQRPPTQGSMSAQQVPQQQNVAQVAQQVGPQASQQISPAVRSQLQNITVHIPPTVAPQHQAAYRQKWMQAAAGHLQQREIHLVKGKEATAVMNQHQKAGQPVPDQITSTLESAKRGMNDANKKFQAMQAQNEQQGRNNQQAAQAGQGQAGQQQQQQQVNGAGGQDMPRSNTFQGNNAEVKAEPRTSMSPQQPQGGFQQQAQQSAPAQNAPNMSQPQQTPQTATQAQPPQNFPQAPQQQQQQQYPNQQRPQINPQGSQSQIPQQHQQTPTSAIPNSAQQPQRPQALSQQAAMEQAAQSYSRQNQMPNQGQGSQTNVPQVPNGLPFNAPPSASQPTPTSAGFPQHQAPSLQATTTPNHKFPIPKTLTLDPRSQQPVPGPPSRPTYAVQGMMQQPAYQRQPPFTLEGDGEKGVLSKRKLDELVRQVTGTPSTSTNESSFLAPEVEENVLQLADDFVDDVITGACRLAKLRPGATLDIRDVQMVLERNYGIRIPGYTLEEARTVRKFQPSAGWQTKMGAVHTAKTLGGVGKADGS